MRLDNDIFKCIVKNTPLISIDFLIEKDNKYLLGKRINKPAKDYYFSIGGRIYKNETIENAKKRILKEELNIDKFKEIKFIGVFEHLYNNSIFDKISTHYINLGFIIKADIKEFPKIQHNSYIWLSKEEILKSNLVHKYLKDYFKGIE